MVDGFAAGPQALGYFYQARYALFLLLDSDEDSELSIEVLDDVIFGTDGSIYELLQFKHHINSQASLSDSSPDLWKTIGTWSMYLKQSKISFNTLLTLITNASAPNQSIASLLRADKNRNLDIASHRLLQIATASQNANLRPSFEAFLALSDHEREHLLDSIRILDQSKDISDVSSLIKKKINLTVRREYLDSLYERLEGWWLAKVIQHLVAKSKEPITWYEVHDKICEIADQLRADSLPIDFLDAKPPIEPDPRTDNRRFVLQLRLIAVHNKRIEKAILDYYRAFEQRSRWAREELLIGNELDTYEKSLMDEWERHFWACQEKMETDDASEGTLRGCGREVYDWMEFSADVRIRPRVTEPYVVRGSYHILANDDPPRVGWHPKFLDRLEELLASLSER